MLKKEHDFVPIFIVGMNYAIVVRSIIIQKYRTNTKI